MPSSLHSVPFEEDSDSKIGLFLGIFFVFLVGITIGHCWWVGDMVAMVSACVIGIGSFLGYVYGLWKTIASSAGASLGYWFAEPAAQRLVPYVEAQTGHSIPASSGLLISGIGVAALVTLVFWMVGAIVFRRSRFLKQCDRYSGFLFGLGNSVAVVSLLLWGLLASESAIKQAQQSNPVAREDKVLQGLDHTIIATKASYVIIALRDWNPYLEVPQFQELKRLMDKLIATRSNRRVDSSPLSSQSVEAGLGLQKLIDVMSSGQLSNAK